MSQPPLPDPPQADVATPAIEAEILPPSSPRSSRLTLIAIGAVIFGAFGLLNVFGTLTNVALGSTFRQAFSMPKPKGVSDKYEELQAQFQLELQRVMDRNQPYNLATAAVQLFVAGGLLLSGVAVLRNSPSGLSWLSIALAVTAVFELARAIVSVIGQMEVLGVTKQFISGLLETIPAGKDADTARQMLQMWMGFMGHFMLAISLLWLLAKEVFYLWGFITVRRARHDAE